MKSTYLYVSSRTDFLWSRCLFPEHRITLKKKPIGYPENPKIVGEHIRKVRMDRKLLQKEVAKLIGVSEDCITYWENGRSEPQIQFMPKIIEFLGYMPVEVDTSTFEGKLKMYRMRHGLSHKKLGKLLGVDASTVGAWENNFSRPQERTQKLLIKIINSV
ncbi:MAG: helix-turn-helix domain-containing protein [Bacteroidota bacterium]